MANVDMTKGKVRGLISKIANIGLIALGFVSVFFATQAKNHAVDTHEDMYGTQIAHADAPTGFSGDSGASGSGSGGCGGGDGAGDGGGAGSGCGCY